MTPINSTDDMMSKERVTMNWKGQINKRLQLIIRHYIKTNRKTSEQSIRSPGRHSNTGIQKIIAKLDEFASELHGLKHISSAPGTKNNKAVVYMRTTYFNIQQLGISPTYLVPLWSQYS
jgi:predicted HTH transcriptional regulator